ncbi:hypothetical protein L6164_013099 [Bauhinia variegata]|uniref:Uncharacterized protein n=1 Tax=Bauhinia variegata TaxID=167791 RepID=A0ACB9PCD6_BAUVA|nr:hypothetical protein L6164_013099 [Bauhinia variegata]
MAESETVVSSNSGEQVRLVHLNFPILADDNIESQVQQTHSRTIDKPQLRQPLLITISHILEPATHFVDSILLDKKVTEKRDALESSNLWKLYLALPHLRKYGEDFCDFDIITRLIERTIDKAEEMFDEINVDQASIHILQYLSEDSWDDKAVITMGNLALKFVDLLELLLHGPNQSSLRLSSSMAALKKNPVSLVGTTIEKFQQALDQLNSLIKITLELIQHICELTLLQDTEYSREDLVSVGVYWAILSTVAGYIQISLIIDNG